MRVKLPNPPTANIRKKVSASIGFRKLKLGGRVKRTTGNRAAVGRQEAVAVLKDWILERRVRWNARALTDRPAIVGASSSFINLLRGVFADIVDQHPPSFLVEGEREGIAQAQRPD